MKIFDTDRLTLRELTEDDASFILELLNEPSFLRFIGDRGVRTISDARSYVLNGPILALIPEFVNESILVPHSTSFGRVTL